jgi:uncharacterized integral membrane protein
MAKFLRSLVAIVGLIIIVTFSVANRGPVLVNFFPLPLPAVSLPLFAVFLIGIFIGAILGGLSLWLSESEMRSEWRMLRRRARAEAYRQKQQELAEEQVAAERSQQRQDALALASPRR